MCDISQCLWSIDPFPPRSYCRPDRGTIQKCVPGLASEGDSRMAGKIKPGVALGLAALAATVIASPAAAGASTATRNSASGAAVATGTITSVQGAAMPGATV